MVGSSWEGGLWWPGLSWVGLGWYEVRTEACGKLNALECFRMVDRITRSNSIRNTLCCCFYYLCLWLSFVRLCPLSFSLVVVVVVFLLSEVKFVCWKGEGGEGGARRGVARQRKARRLLWGLLLHKKNGVQSYIQSLWLCPSPLCGSVCVQLCVRM